MASNQIISKQLLGAITVTSGKKIAISAATKTTSWDRPEFLIKGMKGPLEKAVMENEHVLPPRTAEVCERDREHVSASDERTHITAVAYDDKGNVIQTVHLATDNRK